MKWSYTLLLAGALVVLFGLPFRGHNTASLLPVRTIVVERVGADLRLTTEAGTGTGRTWKQAVRNLRSRASGEVFLETAEQAVFCGRAAAAAQTAAESGDLRPAAQVYFSRCTPEFEGLHAFLSAHETKLTVADLRREAA